jgi:multiple sugar transport system substrate-binding protein/raffinose/stachyose/melibiose transport system substrate-binding protein
MITHKVQATIGLLLVLVLLLVACGPEETGSKPAEVAPATVHWATWEVNSDAERILIEQFREQYPQVDFKRSELNFRWRDLLDQTPLPDLMNMDIDYAFDQMLAQDQLADLTELWEESGLFAQMPASLQKLSERNGKQFFVPFGFGWVGFYYNKAIFAQYDLQPPQSWTEFLQVCETLLANGERPLAISGNDAWSNYEWFEYLNLRLNGPTFHRDLLRGKERYDDPRVRIVAETWKSLFDKGYFVENPQVLGGLTALTTLVRKDDKLKLTSEEAVMALSDAYNASQLPAPFMVELGFFRFPLMDEGQPRAEAVNLFGYVVPVGADHIPQALAFLQHLSTPASQEVVAQSALFSSVTYAPVRVDVDMARLRFDQSKAITMLQETEETVPFFWLALPRETWGMMSFSFEQFVRKRDVELFLGKLETARQQGVDKGLLAVE